MGKLDDLIKKLCPDGVEYKTLGEVIFSLNTGLNPRKFFRLNTDDAQNYYVTIREMVNGKIIFTDSTDRINDEALRLCNNRSNLEKGDVLFSGTGTIGRTVVIEEDPENWNIKEGVYTIKPNQSLINSKYLSYLLQSDEIKRNYMKKVAGGTVQSIPMGDLRNQTIPVPPLEVQNEIVRILDKFTSLEAELEAELEARRKQYEYYRDSLFTFGDDVEWKTLGEISTIFRGEYITQKNSKKGNIPVILGGLEPAYYIDKANHNGEVIVISRSGASAGFVSYWNEPIFITDGFGFEANEDLVTSKFLYLSLKNKEKKLNEMKRGAGVPHVSGEKLKAIKFPVPPIEQQNEIVSILDRFESLCNDITSGLPAEIEARHKQYEYYRDKLLTFKKKV